MSIQVVYKQFGDETAKANTNQTEVPGKQDGAEQAGNNSRDASTETAGSQTDRPLKIIASASSVRFAVQSNTYYPANAIDGKRATAWIEGVENGAGLGEWIRFDFDREINLHRILIQPGYFKSPQKHFSLSIVRDHPFPVNPSFVPCGGR